MDWQDLRVALVVSRAGTVSGAAENLGIHHATVIRHIDRLEARLGQKLFLRHSRGYEPTDAGQKLFNVAAVADEQFTQARARLESREAEVSGKFVITTLPGLSSLIMPAISKFLSLYPEIELHLEMSTRLYRLEYGEAHIAIRAGSKPTDLDNIVRPLAHLNVGLYASAEYTEKHGHFDGRNVADHRFIAIGSGVARAPHYRWLSNLEPKPKFAIHAGGGESNQLAIREGIGLGFLNAKQQNTQGLIEHLAPRPEWEVAIWRITHRDMHRSAKVQAFLKCL